MSLNISLILLGCFITNIMAITNSPTICNNLYTEILCIRNNALRTILSNKFNRTRQKCSVIKRMINRNITHKFNKVLSRYYDANYSYHCLTESEKTLLEVFVSLTY